MNVVSSPKMHSGLKKVRLLMFWGIFFLVVTIGLGVWAYMISTKEVKAVPMNSLIVDRVKESTFAEVKATTIPYAFAEYDDTSDKYYFVFDDEHLYIVYLSKATYQTLNRDDIDVNPTVITGMTKTIPQDVRKLAIEVYNEINEKEILTEENFEDYLGAIYLDTTVGSSENDLQILFAFISGSLGIGLLIFAIINQRKTKKKIQSFTESEWRNIEQELESDSTISYHSLNLHFTEHYIVDLSSGIDIFSYQDILWMYPYLLKQYGITTNKNVILVTKDKKKHQIANVSNFSKKSKDTYNDIMSFIYDKNQKMLVGYTKENIQEMKNLYGIK